MFKNRKNHGRFIAACLAMVLAFSPAVATEALMTQNVMAATSTEKPTESKITSMGTSVISGVNTVSLTWNKAQNTTNYRIYYKEAGGSWELMKSFGSAKTSASLSSTSAHPINTGVTYYFTVRTYNKNSGKYGLWDKTGTKVCFQAATVTPGRSDITKATPSVKSGINTVDLTWSRAENITNYKIYYKEMNGSWKRIKTLDSSSTSATFSSSSTAPFESGKSYMFTVRTYNSSTDKWGKWDKTGTKVTFPANTQSEYVKVETIEFTNTGNTMGGSQGIAEGPFKLEIKIIPSNATDKSVYWTSSNPAVATVSSDGVVTPLKAGRTDIRVHPNGGDYPGSVYELLVIDEELMSQQIFELTNQERIKAGLAPVRNSEFIHKFAMMRAKEISTNFTHRRPNGEFVGYSENIAAYGSGGDASAIVTAWMNSPGHRRTILGNSKTLGVGVYIEGGQEYCVQDFCDMDADQTFTITFDCNGGTGPSSMEVSQKQKIHQSDLPVPQRPGYTFKGWAIFNRAIFNSATITSDITLTAVWEPIS